MVSTPADLVRSHLLRTDQPCPGCRYNLRGNTSLQCPECGREFVLADIPAEMPAPPPGRLLRVSALVLAMGVEWAATKAAFIIHQPSDGQAAFAYFVPCGCSLFGLVPLVFEVIGGGSRRSDRILPYLSWGWAALCLIAGGFVLLRGP